MNLFLALISLGLIPATPAMASTIAPLPYTIENAPVIIQAYAAHYGIPAQPLLDTLECESGYDPAAMGDHGTSLGVAQIHLPAHPDITKEEALNPFFAIDYAAQQFAAGHQMLWSCFKKTHGAPGP